MNNIVVLTRYGAKCIWKYLSTEFCQVQIQVLQLKSKVYLSAVNVYLKVLKYKYTCTWPHTWYKLELNKKGAGMIQNTSVNNTIFTYVAFKLRYG